MEPLSQKLAELSVQAKNAEDRIAAAKSKAQSHLEQQREQLRSEAHQALGQVKQRFEDAKGEARTRFDALHAKVDADFDLMKREANEAKREFEAWQAENYASDKEADALAAIEYAAAATKIAELQALDAIAARIDVDSRAEQVRVTPAIL